MIDSLKGWRTLLTGFLIAVGPAALNWLGDVNTQHALGLSPSTAAVLGIGIMLMRTFTTSPPGQSVHPAQAALEALVTANVVKPAQAASAIASAKAGDK